MRNAAALMALMLGFVLTGYVRAGESHVQAKLLADVSAITPGKPFTLGIQLQVTPHWHVYWKNPGDAGQATQVKFTLPEGFSAGDLQFPVPTRMDQAGGIVAFGYEDTVLLTATITPPKQLPPNFNGNFTAQVSWLVCKDVCILGRQKVELSLPASDTASPANQELFQQWMAQIPVDAAASPMVAAVAAHGIVKPDQDPPSGAFVLDVNWKGAAPRGIQFLPGSLDAYNIKDVQVQSDGDHTRIGFTLQAFAGQKPSPAVLQAVVGYLDKDAGHRAITTTINLPDAGSR